MPLTVVPLFSAAWVTIKSLGLSVAPLAVIRITAVRAVPVLAEYVQVMVPELVALLPEEIDNQSLPETTAAFQGMLPEPELATPKKVVPAAADTSREIGHTVKTGSEIGDAGVLG